MAPATGRPPHTTDRGGYFAVVDPSTGEAFDEAPDRRPEELDPVVDRARAAWPGWRADPAARRTALLAAADAVEAAATALAPLLTREQGKPLTESHAEVARTAARLRYFAELDIGAQPITDDRPVHSRLRWRSIGAVAAIVPWNFPLQLASAKFAPALAAGNTMVLKPSPSTPLATRMLGAVLAGSLPEGVLTVVTGREPLGARLASHPGIRHVTFTGSAATGRAVAAGAAASLARVTLELGGNDAAILLDDVDVEEIADRLFWAAFRNCGQVCMAVKRVYAPARLHDRVVEALAHRASTTVVGPGLDPASRIGPVSNAPQLAHVERRTARALADGGRAAAGGHRLDRPGYFFAPTILADVPAGSPVVTEEQFGPVLPVLPYDSLDEAVRAANDTGFGLGGSVWSTDLDRAAAVADRLECGTAWINHHAELSLAQPFAGAKDSGVGVAGGPWGLYGNLRPFVVHRPEEA
ncbi:MULTISPECIES: aldehyde dehydrogenase family protein [Streptomyces]|uniref:Aldehyde dehydrogenase n=1 Tax=Streptomyces coelicolor (strain ATCC BAA-471 / A3(2) / M145) TaxID=100226 RepID=Q9ZBH2_STRCO|nr:MULTISPECIES: aldehyde dehydrogenase family protein [Streptomyces]MDX2923911.1 aldehyde dehydrogenase family protein [Streptomyces sp. NRRL_B-16638]MDX3407364.1 aldehyde dehydrogenase family protein [Streptomyces sp. ME02-6977A]MYU45945.1 aldehyde dehydrogenase family protein [Streptomyces sp. SID7813]NSL78634.1 aldehyde dehydrogenase family protein [Streptomyces coelicolor]QFI46243.1 aldehyde dehydrogenase family protein [Streptomyces coelicolor A3(2)]